MKLKNVVGLIREESRKPVLSALREFDIRGVTVTSTQGYGEYINTFDREGLNACVRIDVYISEERAEEVANIIMQAAHSGLEGDGLVVIVPVEGLYRIKDQQAITEFA